MKPSIGHNLRMLSFQKNFTQLQVAQAVGISENSLSRYEQGQRTPSEELLYKFAEFYEVPVSKIRVE
ncbi:helix-turn-helix transcriptional regulator [Bacillus sp. JJ1562]|uniref:helix-turn-helix transcriptional regulator n=1 Tax=Bacillus sp. JJ1562 TaxID=3122960 RepID=UPI003001DEDD